MLPSIHWLGWTFPSGTKKQQALVFLWSFNLKCVPVLWMGALLLWSADQRRMNIWVSGCLDMDIFLKVHLLFTNLSLKSFKLCLLRCIWGTCATSDMTKAEASMNVSLSCPQKEESEGNLSRSHSWNISLFGGTVLWLHERKLWEMQEPRLILDYPNSGLSQILDSLPLFHLPPGP